MLAFINECLLKVSVALFECSSLIVFAKGAVFGLVGKKCDGRTLDGCKEGLDGNGTLFAFDDEVIAFGLVLFIQESFVPDACTELPIIVAFPFESVAGGDVTLQLDGDGADQLDGDGFFVGVTF